jgi:hypothetical protein
MPKYRIDFVMEFESETNLPDVNHRGNIAEAIKLLEGLPSPAGVDHAKSFASFKIERRRPSTPDPY